MLAMGPKFILLPNSILGRNSFDDKVSTTLTDNSAKLIRSLSLDFHFRSIAAHQPAPETPRPYHYMRSPNPDFIPKPPKEAFLLLNRLNALLLRRFKDIPPLLKSGYAKLNVPRDHLRSLASLLSHDEIAIVLSDKNMGFAIVDSHLLYEAIDLKFNNNAAYERFPFAPNGGEQVYLALSTACKTFNSVLTPRSGSTDEMFALWHTVSAPAILPSNFHRYVSSINPLAKVHKPSFNASTFRFIAQAHKSPFQRFDMWFAKATNPLVGHFIPTYLRDSGHLLHELNNLLLPNAPVTVIVADATDLYGNLSTISVLNGLQFAYSKLLELSVAYDFPLPWSINAFMSAMKIANSNAFVQIRGSFYRQVKGIAMGRAAGVHIANFAVGLIESNMKRSHPLLFDHILLHKRYIDDVLLVVQADRKVCEEIIALYDHATGLKWNATYYDFSPNSPIVHVPFLDLALFRLGSRIVSKLYSKETALNLFIPPRSLHPKHVHPGWIRANLSRFARNCSLKADYLDMASSFFGFLRARGFAHSFLLRVFANFDYENNRTAFFAQQEKRFKTLAQQLEAIPPSRSSSHFLSIPFHPTTAVFNWTRLLNDVVTNFYLHAPDEFTRICPQPKLRTAWSNLPSNAALVSQTLKATHLGQFNPNPNAT